MFGNVDRNGQLTVDGSDLMTPMSRIMNLFVLLRDEDVIGDDTRVSGGKVLNPQRGDGIRETLNLQILGDVDHNGDAYSDLVDGLISNISWIRTNITGRTGTGDGTRSLELVWGGVTRTATGRVGPLHIGSMMGDGSVTATCDVWIPVGTFVEP